MTVEAVLRTRSGTSKTIPGDLSVAAARRIMRENHVTALAVGDAGVGVDGIVTERLLIRALRSLGVEALMATPVRDVMRRHLPACRPGDSLRGVMTSMTARGLRHMAVIDEGGLHGIVSLAEIVNFRLQQAEREVEAARAALGNCA